ncbi:MAG: phage virion morphogenesis protein [Spirochaetaceae bacterium]|jgi:phage virion morphogenesis protein|nr:phage virion morphogenesis protein [Spirochaetaceae bacterium]
MAGTGIEVKVDDRFQAVLDALTMAAKPDLLAISRAMGEELESISNDAFEDEADPVTGTKWEPLKYPREDGSTGHLLRGQSILYASRRHIDTPEGTTLGSNMIYARIHQEGGQTGPHTITPKHAKALYFNGRFAKQVNHPGSRLSARPYMGVPQDFDRRFLNDPAILTLLGIKT